VPFSAMGWCSGNLVNAVNATHKWNRREDDRFYRKWDAGALPEWRVAQVPGGAWGAEPGLVR
ncbi:MAG: hypothetical protein ACYDA8_05295, partial [Deferrisomatales bacterium]